jgi:hypothetical protein
MERASRPYNYEENLVRENSRTRKNRKQLCFNDKELELINDNMNQLGITNFSLYMRAVACYGKISKEEIENLKDILM